MKKIGLLICSLLFISVTDAQISVDKTGRYLITKSDGKPFFMVADTGWELFHRLNRDEVKLYLDTRKKQEFNVIMSVALAELNGLREPNRYGSVPFKDLESLEWATTPGNNPNVEGEYDYWDHVDFVVKEAAKRGLYIGLLPTWGDKVASLWGEGPRIFKNNPDAAYTYAKRLAERYRDDWNIVWILGGDRQAVYESDGKKHDDRPVWRAMAKAIEETYNGDVFITYHTSSPATTAFFPNEDWLDMHSLQSSHGNRAAKAWDVISEGLKVKPHRPMMDLEPCYEDHPVNIWDGKWTRESRGFFSDYDVRARTYRGVFAGGAGAAYGHCQVWQFFNPESKNTPVSIGDTIIGWKKGIESIGAYQVRHLKRLMLSHSDFNRIEDNSLIVSDRGKDYTDLIIATRNRKGSYALIYLPQSKPIDIDLDKLMAGRKKVSWFNPANGKYHKIRKSFKTGVQTFTPPNEKQKDWVLVVDVR